MYSMRVRGDESTAGREGFPPCPADADGAGFTVGVAPAGCADRAAFADCADCADCAGGPPA
ncbi:hypothetical protein DZF91_25285, partial [Actinomadura logoneensis]